MRIIKTTIYALAALLLLTAFIGIPVAATEQSITIDVPSTEVPWNEKTTVPVMIHNPIDISGIQIAITQCSGVDVSFNTTHNPLSAQIGVKYVWYSVSPLNTDTVLFYLDLVPDQTVPVKEVSITLNVEELVNSSYDDLISSYPVIPATLKIAKAPSVVDGVAITSPLDETELVYGSEGVATAVVYDQYGDVMDSQVTWSVINQDGITPATGLTIDASTGVYKVVNCAEESVQIFAEANDVCTSNTVKLVKADLTSDDFVVSNLEQEWTGNAIEASVSSKDGVTGIGDITVTYNGLDAIPTQKGTYAVNVSVTDGDNYNAVSDLYLGILTITGKQIERPTITSGFIYTGETITAITPESDYYSVIGNTGVAAGQYTATFILNDKVNTEWKYNYGTENITFTWDIYPASLDSAIVTPRDRDYYYPTYTGDEQTQKFTVTHNDVELLESVDFEMTGNTATAAGTYTATVTGIGNYTGTATGAWDIKRATPGVSNITCTIPTDLVYSGTEHILEAVATDGIYGLGEITLTYNGASSAVNAGTYKVNASIAEGQNYTDVSNLYLGDLVIAKAELTANDFNLSASSAEFSNEPQSVIVTTEKAGVTVTETKYNGTTTAPTQKGTYIVSIDVNGGDNYKDVSDLVVGTFAITGKQIAEPEIIGTYTYDGTVQNVQIPESEYYKIVENATATAAGIYSVVLQLTQPDSTVWTAQGNAENLTLQWTITEKPLKGVTLTQKSPLTYTGAELRQEFTVTLGSTTLVAGTDYTIDGVTGTNAGEYTAIVTGIGNYTGISKQQWTIALSILPMEVIDYNIPTGIIYNGQPQGITVEFNASYAGVGALTVSYGDSTEIPTNAGTYAITASVTEGENYKAGEFNLGEYVILPAELSKDNLSYSLDAVTYDGNEHPVSVTLKDGKTGDITVTYNDSAAVPVSAGTYQVNVTVKNVANYNNTEFNLGIFTINKAVLSVENFEVIPSLTESIVFDGKEHQITVTPQGIVGYGDISVTYNDGTAIPVAIGTYKVNITVINGQNYADAELNLGTLTITGLKIAEPTLTETQFTYDGSAKTPEIVDSTNSKDRYTVVQENLTATAAGTYTITLQLKDAANTSWSGASGAGDLKLTWTINPTSIAGVSVSTTEETIIYDGSEKKPNFVVKSGETILSKNDYEISGIISSFAAGNHTVTVTGKNNYTGTATGTWEIAKAAPTDDVVDFTIPSGVVYNGHPQGITAALNASYAGVGELSLKYYNGTTEEQPVNAGIYLVNATVAEGQNYTAAEFTLGNFEILRANPSVDNLTFTLPENAVYNGKMFEADCVAKEGVELGAITVVYNATPIAAGTYKVNASIAESLNFNATELTIGEFTIAKATLTSDNLTVTPELPVSYDNESGSVKPVVVTLKPGIFGNGTIKVEYGESTALPTLAGVYKVNANITAGTNYTAGTIYLGDMTVVEKVAPKFESVVITTTETNTTVTGADTVDSTNTTQISDGSGVVLKITFSDYEQESNTVSGNISAVIVQYPEKPAASPQKKAEGTTYNLTIDLGNKLTTALPEITPVYNDDVEKKVSNKLESTNTNSKKITFTGLAMMTATGDNVDDINKNITKKDGVKLTFKIPQFDLSDKEKIVVYHVSGNSVVKVYEGKPTADNGHYLITVTGSGFSSYVAGVEETTVTQSTGGSTPPVNSGGTGSGKKPTTVPTTPPTEEPTEDPTDKPDTPDVPGIDTPTEPETPATPAPVAGMILGALAAAAVLRRK